MRSVTDHFDIDFQVFLHKTKTKIYFILQLSMNNKKSKSKFDLLNEIQTHFAVETIKSTHFAYSIAQKENK